MKYQLFISLVLRALFVQEQNLLSFSLDLIIFSIKVILIYRHLIALITLHRIFASFSAPKIL